MLCCCCVGRCRRCRVVSRAFPARTVGHATPKLFAGPRLFDFVRLPRAQLCEPSGGEKREPTKSASEIALHVGSAGGLPQGKAPTRRTEVRTKKVLIESARREGKAARWARLAFVTLLSAKRVSDDFRCCIARRRGKAGKRRHEPLLKRTSCGDLGGLCGGACADRVCDGFRSSNVSGGLGRESLERGTLGAQLFAQSVRVTNGVGVRRRRRRSRRKNRRGDVGRLRCQSLRLARPGAGGTFGHIVSHNAAIRARTAEGIKRSLPEIPRVCAAIRRQMPQAIAPETPRFRINTSALLLLLCRLLLLLLLLCFARVLRVCCCFLRRPSRLLLLCLLLLCWFLFRLSPRACALRSPRSRCHFVCVEGCVG